MEGMLNPKSVHEAPNAFIQVSTKELISFTGQFVRG